MARYIDADILRKNEIARCHCVPCVGSNDNNYKDLDEVLNDCPTADVVPKSEVERLKAELETDIINANMNLEHITYEFDLLKQEKSVVVAETIKEFADRPKTYYRHLDRTAGGLVEYHIDEVVKEMTSSDAPKVVHKDYFTPKEGVNNE